MKCILSETQSMRQLQKTSQQSRSNYSKEPKNINEETVLNLIGWETLKVERLINFVEDENDV